MSLKRINEALGYYNKGIRCLQTGQFAEAITQLRIATHLNPGNPDAFAALCLAAHEAESDDLLFHTSLMNLLDFPDGPAISRGMAINSYQIGFYLEAILYALKSQVICPNDVLSTYILGRSYLAARMFEEAKRSLRRAFELAPDFTVVRSLLNWLVTYLSVPELDRIPIVDLPGVPLHKYPRPREKQPIQRQR
jgi:tetratricopeptide (TPR) repeat protein